MVRYIRLGQPGKMGWGTDLGLPEYLSTSSHAERSVIASNGRFGGRMPTKAQNLRNTALPGRVPDLVPEERGAEGPIPADLGK